VSEAAADTVWRAGRFDAKAGPRTILFGRMYEDVQIERRAFEDGARVFCIASAGCTALGLCDRHEVVACDINPVQLAYAGERLHGAPARVGTAENVMAFARSLAPLAGWGKETLSMFLDLADVEAQAEFWKAHLDTWRFRTGFDAMLSLVSLRAVYSRDLLAFLPKRFGAVLRARMERCIGLHPNATNPYARALFAGEPASAASGESARRIELVLSDAASYLESCAPGSFGAFTLSNILDGATMEYRGRLFRAVRRASAPEGVVVLRSFGEPSGPSPWNQAERDRAMLWGIVDVRRVEELAAP